jgi:hypothetical protein
VTGRRYLRHAPQPEDVTRAGCEVIQTNQTTVGTATVLIILRDIDLLEECAAEDIARVVFKVLEQLILADIEKLYCDVRLKIGVLNQLIDAAPGRLQMLKLRMMKDLVELFIDQYVDLTHGLHDLALLVAAGVGIGIKDNCSETG